MVRIAVLDVETTGLDYKVDSVIELAVSRFSFDPATSCFSDFECTQSWLQDPGRPLNEEITLLTGLRDQDLLGKAIDWSHVGQILADCDLVISHNAAFDRPFIDRVVPVSSQKLWGCSAFQIDWRGKGFERAKLDILRDWFQISTTAHRAGGDVDAVVAILQKTDEHTGRPYMSELYENARMPAIRVEALGSVYEVKDLLKARRYRWDSEKRVWWKFVPEALWPDEKKWLEAEIYHGPFVGSEETIAPRDRFTVKPVARV